MLSLAVTSSTSVVGVAVARIEGADGDGGLAVGGLVAHEVATDRRHAEELTPLLVLTLAEAGVAMGDIERLVVDVGPGRFTGLRVGLATVRTLALALDVEVVGVTSLEILAAAVVERPVVAVVDARRAEVFQQRFDDGGPVGPPVVGPPAELAAAAAGAVVVGDGADRYLEIYGPAVVTGRNPSAATMLRLAADRPSRPGHRIEPCYLRDPDVHINVKTRPGTAALGTGARP
ncbi:MAG: tRNA (adenosine(37)-N6)-threonylcarbamoyltransferase complex dimerization subunit type 1 TsaB [Acidimicrobiales bacterium]